MFLGPFGRVGAVNEVVVGVMLTVVLKGVSAGWRHSRGLSGVLGLGPGIMTTRYYLF